MCCVLFALHFFSLHAYSDWLNTSITAPDGSVTAVRHFVSRQVQYVQGPTGIRNSFTYQGRRLLSTLQPSDELITMEQWEQWGHTTLLTGGFGFVHYSPQSVWVYSRF